MARRRVIGENGNSRETLCDGATVTRHRGVEGSDGSTAAEEDGELTVASPAVSVAEVGPAVPVCHVGPSSC